MTKNEIAYIIEWLYINDGGFPNKTMWRKSFVKMLETMISYPPLQYSGIDSEEKIEPGKVMHLC